MTLPQLREHNQSAQQQARMGQLGTRVIPGVLPIVRLWLNHTEQAGDGRTRVCFDSELLEPLTQQVSRTCTSGPVYGGVAALSKPTAVER